MGALETIITIFCECSKSSLGLKIGVRDSWRGVGALNINTIKFHSIFLYTIIGIITMQHFIQNFIPGISIFSEFLVWQVDVDRIHLIQLFLRLTIQFVQLQC